MDRSSVPWRGYWVAAPTLFVNEEALDVDATKRLMEHYVRTGVHGVLINGSTGEWWSQTDDERRELADIAVAAIAGRIPVVVGCTDFTPAGVARLARHAQSVGADGVLCTPPPYAHPTQAEIVDFFARVNDLIELPLLAYDWPRGTSVSMDVETAATITRLDRVVGFKVSTDDWVTVSDYVESLVDRALVFTWVISRRGLALVREFGCDGYIDGGGLGAPHGVGFFEALWEGRLDDARECARAFAQLNADLVNPDFSGRYGSWSAQLKAAMELLGQPTGTVRSPVLPVTSEEALEGISKALRSARLLA